jgi:hypothetical protein
MAGNILQWCLDWSRPIILNNFANARTPPILTQREKHDVVSHRNKRIARRTSAAGMREKLKRRSIPARTKGWPSAFE